MAISMLKIRRPLGRLIFNMGIAIPGKTVFLIETAPRTHMGRTANIIIKDIIHIFASISKVVYFADGTASSRALPFTQLHLHEPGPVFNFNSSPIANAMKNSFGLWDLKIL